MRLMGLVAVYQRPNRCAFATECGEIDALHPGILSRAVLDGTAGKRWSIAPGTAQDTRRDRILINTTSSLQ
jgi:hypothetical protein